MPKKPQQHPMPSWTCVIESGERLLVAVWPNAVMVFALWADLPSRYYLTVPIDRCGRVGKRGVSFLIGDLHYFLNPDGLGGVPHYVRSGEAIKVLKRP